MSSFFTCLPELQIMMYGVWFLRHGMQQTAFFPHPRNNLENNNSEKMKKVFGDAII